MNFNVTYDPESLEQIKMFQAIYEDKTAEVNGREYTLSNTTHEKRLRVFAFLTSIAGADLRWLTSKEWKEVQKILDNVIMYEGSALVRLPAHWEKYEEDFLMLYMGVMGALSYPFMRGSIRGSQSPNQQDNPTI